MYIGMGPEGVQGAIGKPPGRLRRGEILCETGKYKKGPFLAFHKKPVTCERFRPPAGGRGTFPHGKVPKGCRGRPKGACLVAAPGPPVAKEQCTASLAGARPASFTTSLGGPLSPSAQLIPPPAFGRRCIPRVVARGRHGRETLLRYVPRLRRQTKCGSATAPDWLLAPSQTKWRARCGSCRSRSRVKHPSAAKKARRLSHLRAYFYFTYCHFST